MLLLSAMVSTCSGFAALIRQIEQKGGSDWERALKIGESAEACSRSLRAVNVACCPAGVSCNAFGIPLACGSVACADAYMPYYQQCGTTIRLIEQNKYSDYNGFSSLYSSCVGQKHATNGAGQVVDHSLGATSLYDFSTATASSLIGWKVVVDGVMGGRSRGTWRLAKPSSVFSASTGAPASARKQQCALLSGSIELTHGGFVNVKSPTLATPNGYSSAHGLRICSKSSKDYGKKDGHGDRYKLNLYVGGSSYTTPTWQADFQTAEAGSKDTTPHDGCEGVIATIPYNQFWPSHWGRITGAQGSIDPSKIVGMGFDVSFQTANGDDNPELDHQACASGSARCKNDNPFGLCVQWIEAYELKQD